jgi:hypothetical protein
VQHPPGFAGEEEKERAMKTLLKSAVVALTLVGASMGAANAQASFGFVIGPDGARVAVTQGYYYDRDHYRHFYRYPSEWRRFHHPMGWYRNHDYWWRDHDWYR